MKFFYFILILFISDFISANELDSQKKNELDYKTFTFAGEQRYLLDGSIPKENTELRPIPASIVGGIYLSAYAGLYWHQRNTWWSGGRKDFRFIEDWIYALQVDKVGHMYGTYIASWMFTEALLVSGVSKDMSPLYGSLMGLAYETYVEIEDGFGENWGFAPSDFYFDAVGSLFQLAQWYIPELQNVNFKWQYAPAEWLGKPVINREHNFMDDYNASTFWLSFNVHNMLPQDYKKYWPKWLNIAIGYGGDAIDANKDPNSPTDKLSYRRFVLGLDYNLVQLLPDDGAFWNWLKNGLNNIKFPAPAFEYSKNGGKFYLLYPFQIKF